MGFFNSMRVISKANDILRRMEGSLSLLEQNLNNGNYTAARTYCDECARNGREFLETVQMSQTAEMANYRFRGFKFNTVQLAMLFREALNSANEILTGKGYY